MTTWQPGDTGELMCGFPYEVLHVFDTKMVVRISDGYTDPREEMFTLHGEPADRPWNNHPDIWGSMKKPERPS